MFFLVEYATFEKRKKMGKNFNDKKLAELLYNYAVFLESVLGDNDYNLSSNGILEIVDSRFITTSDYFGRGNCNDDSQRKLFLSLNVATENFLDDFMKTPDKFKNINIVYSQMPFNKPNSLIHKLSLVPVITSSVAIFGAYGLKKNRYERFKNLESLNKFTSYLVKNGLGYERFFSQNNDSYFELVLSRNRHLKHS